MFYRISGRRTQTILPVDAAYIIYTGSINGSKKILESGVGTGNLSYSILNSINASGKLVSVDIDKQNIENARKNVYSLINPNNWELINGDIKTFKTEELFDTIILDMPEPWECVDNLKNNLKFGGYFITYSPTFNQAEKNVLSLNKNNFTVLETVELIKRNILVRENATRPDNNIIGHTAFITIAVKLNVL
ncbi:methyltransferase domain-containing protein [Acidiplasma cupricumulans]|uniref:tRNA (adenine-N1)-methyltransferase n=1 Tax=Acidiplasma cupricumulans TaxID=312540 RepID=UPI0015857E80|nr:methyltransferase domain-containing protein [Acidiplasma cupricumulans]